MKPPMKQSECTHLAIEAEFAVGECLNCGQRLIGKSTNFVLAPDGMAAKELESILRAAAEQWCMCVKFAIARTKAYKPGSSFREDAVAEVKRNPCLSCRAAAFLAGVKLGGESDTVEVPQTP